MSRTTRRLALLTAAVATLVGCGGSTGVVLTIDSSYSVPTEVDGLVVTVSSPQHAEKVVAVDLSRPFPHTLAVVVEDVSGTLTVRVQALLGADVVTQAQIQADLVHNRMLEYRVDL